MAVTLNSLWGFFDLPLLLISRRLIDTVIEAITSPDWQAFKTTIFWLMILQGGLEFARQVVSRSSQGLNMLLTRRIDAQMSMEVARKKSELEISVVESPEFQDIYDRIEKESSRKIWGLIRPLFDVFQGIVGLVANLIIVASFAPLVMVLIILLTVPRTVVHILMGKKHYELREKMSGEYRVWSWLTDYLQGGKTGYEVRIFDLKKPLVRKIKKLLSDLFGKRERLEWETIGWNTLVRVPEQIFLIGFNIFVFFQALAQAITLGYAQMLVRAVTGIQNYLSQVSSSMAEIYQNQLFVKDLVWLLDQESKSNEPQNYNGVPQYHKGYGAQRGRQGAKFVMPLKKGIEFRNVWYKYPQSKDWVLKDISFEIEPKENIALVGENGAGKTTLIKLLCGFYEVQKGEILVNGRDIREYRQNDYLRALSVLFQEFEEYPFSAAESIGYGNYREMTDLDMIKRAAKLTKIDGFISNLPKGYHNPISKKLAGGIEPSKGQWQRIALARALFKRAPILILDEPTSNVDPKAEEEIFNDLIKINRDHLVILISHRFSTVRKADRILVLDQGRLVESGTHESLMRNGQMYAELFTAQAKGYR